jgi:hypothetical protein
VRHKNAYSEEVSEFATRLNPAPLKPLSPSESPRFFLAACASEFAEILQKSAYSKGDLHALEQLLLRTSQSLPMDTQVEELLESVRAAKGLPCFGR